MTNLKKLCEEILEAGEKEKVADRPWVLGGCSGRMITTPDGYIGDGFLADVDTKDNSNFIITAANNIESLARAYLSAMERIEVLEGALDKISIGTGQSSWVDQTIAKEALEKSRAIGGSDMRKFEQAISVLKAAIVILEEQRPSKEEMLNNIIHSNKIDGLKFAIQCLEEVQE